LGNVADPEAASIFLGSFGELSGFGDTAERGAGGCGDIGDF